MVVQSTYLKNMFGVEDIISKGTFVCLSNFQFVAEVSAQSIVTSSKSKYDDLFPASQLIVGVFLIIVGVLFCPFILLFAFDQFVLLYMMLFRLSVQILMLLLLGCLLCHCHISKPQCDGIHCITRLLVSHRSLIAWEGLLSSLSLLCFSASATDEASVRKIMF